MTPKRQDSIKSQLVIKLNFSSIIIEKQTIVFDFDETLAKVHFNKKELPVYDDQVDILTKDNTITVRK